MQQHPFVLANLVAGDHRLAETSFSRIERNEGDRQTMVERVIFNGAVHAGEEEQDFYAAPGGAGNDPTVEENLGAADIDAAAHGRAPGG